MKHVNVKGMDMSVFTLGTVQLGMDYGLGEHTQKPPKEAAFALLDRAAACGVNALDTANNYGDSERTIGEWLRMKRPEDRPYVITKSGHLTRIPKNASGMISSVRQKKVFKH